MSTRAFEMRRRLRTAWLCIAAVLLPLASTTAQSQPDVAVTATIRPDPDAGEECTVGVAVGRATADGRPLLWKNRDAKQRDNVVTAFDDGKWPYVGICNAGSRASVWGGANAAGFCIMNSLSRDLPDGSDTGPSNGPFMKLALRECETVDDFEALLRRTDRTGRRTRANFGVIDAKGGAAFFEASHRSYRRFDAADTPSGIVVRANFAFTGGGSGGKERFQRAETLCKPFVGTRKLDVAWLLREFVRDLSPPSSAQEGEAGQQDVRETIHRQTTVASMVFHGVAAGQDPSATTMWAVLGQPLFSVAVPCWPAAGRVAPEVAGSPRSPICDASVTVQDAFYRDPGSAEEQGSEADVAGPSRWLLTAELPPVLGRVLAAEQELIDECAAAWRRWDAASAQPTPAALYELHARLAERAARTMHDLAARFAPAVQGR